MSYLILLLVILCIIGSAIYTPGTIVLLDFIMAPYSPINWYEPLFAPISHLVARGIGTEWTSKIIFIGILVAGAYLGVLLTRSIVSICHYKNHQKLIEIFGGVFFIINPFVYERMMVQPTIALGVFFLGYVLYYLFFAHRIMKAGLFAALAFMMMPHASYMIVLMFGLYMIFMLRSWRDFGYILLSGVLIISLNINWILAPYIGYATAMGTISTFSVANLEAFQTQALAPMGVWGTNVLLYGFWGEKYASHYVNVSFLSSLWYIAGIILVLLMSFGFFLFWKKERKVTISLLIIGFLSLVFGIGIASSMTVSVTNWMIEHVPLWQGYREPQKWIGLLMMVEGIGFIIGIGYLLQRYGKDLIIKISIIVSVSLGLLIWSPGSLMGYHGQLKTSIFPSSIEAFRNENIASFSGQILVLPWHSYIGCSWIARPVVSNPIVGLLSPLPIIISDNIEAGNHLYSNSTSTRSQDIEKFLSNSDVSLLKKHNISHIFLMRSCASSVEIEDLLTRLENTDFLLPEKSDDLYMFYKIK